MTSKIITKIKDKAEELSILRKEIASIEEENRQRVEGLKERRDGLQSELIGMLGKEGLASIRTDEGETYAKAVRTGYAVVDSLQALKWARENMAFSVDMRIVAQRLKGVKELPKCFEQTTTEYISVRGVKKEE